MAANKNPKPGRPVPQHTAPKVSQHHPGIKLWQPEAYNAEIVRLQKERGEEVNFEERRIDKLHKITDQPFVKQEPGAVGRPATRQAPAVMPGQDVAEPFTGDGL